MRKLLTGTPALFLRTFVFYPLGWLLGVSLAAVEFNADAGFVVIDLNALSVTTIAALGTIGWGGTFVWSRLVSRLGGAT